MSSTRALIAGLAVVGSGTAATGPGPAFATPEPVIAESGPSSTAPEDEIAQTFDVGGGRTLYLECSGEGSPTILLEAGDESGVEEWQPVFDSLAEETRTCAYDRAGVGRSVEATGCRSVNEILGDLEALLAVADVPGPYLLVGASGGGFLMAGFAARHPGDVAGLVLVETPRAITLSGLPAAERAAIACDSPSNVERRDYIAVEHDVWDARAEIGEFPMTIISNDYGPSAPPGERANVVDQQTWLVLSPSSEQVVVTSGHDVVWNEPALVIDEVLAVLAAAREGPA